MNFHFCRSSRSTRARSVSYADADVSEEELSVSDSSEDEEKRVKKAKKQAARKKHVDDLWSSFKADTATEKDKKKTETPTPAENGRRHWSTKFQKRSG